MSKKLSFWNARIAVFALVSGIAFWLGMVVCTYIGDSYSSVTDPHFLRSMRWWTVVGIFVSFMSYLTRILKAYYENRTPGKRNS